MSGQTLENFVTEISSWINDLPKPKVDVELLPNDKKAIELLKQLESALQFDKLSELLKQNAGADQLATPQNLGPFYNFLANRSGKKINDGSYLITPKSLINQSCLKLATKLKATDGAKLKETNPYVYDLLEQNVASLVNSNSSSFHRLILRENGTFLDVTVGFAYLEYAARKKANPLCPPFNIRDFSPLTLTEERLLKNHSTEAAAYAAAITMNKDVAKRREEFNEALNKKDYQVKASYGESSLITSILEEIKSLEALTKIMTDYLPDPKKHWQLFLGTMQKNQLLKLVLDIDLQEIKDQDKQNKDPDLFKQTWIAKADEALIKLPKTQIKFSNETQLRAFTLCSIEAYILCRKEDDKDFKSWTGYYIGYLTSSAFSKDDKIAAAKIFRDYVVNGGELTMSAFESYMKKNNLYDKYWKALTSESYFANNVLANIVKMTMDQAKLLNQQQEKVEYKPVECKPMCSVTG